MSGFMSNIVKAFTMNFGKKEKANGVNFASLRILKEIRAVTADLACADAWFDFEEDSDMLESCIYYIESLRARYRCLLKKARSNNVTISPTNHV